MLEKHVTDFLAYCKVAGFSKKSIESLSISLRELRAFKKPPRCLPSLAADCCAKLFPIFFFAAFPYR